ncbi:MAG: OmpA family protein [Chromatiales bacterium]|jgi:chemotaxis protein MotB
MSDSFTSPDTPEYDCDSSAAIWIWLLVFTLFAALFAVYWYYDESDQQQQQLEQIENSSRQLAIKLRNSQRQQKLAEWELEQTRQKLADIQSRKDSSRTDELKFKAQLEQLQQELQQLRQQNTQLQQQLRQADTAQAQAAKPATSIHAGPAPASSKLTAEQQRQIEQLRHSLTEAQARITDLKNRFTVIELNNEILFKNGEALLKPAGQKLLKQVAELLKNYPHNKIAIQGHSDDQPLRGELKEQYHSNWNLSAARAASAIHYLQHIENIEPERMILVAYSAYNPIVENRDADSRARNRRIEIMLMPEDFAFFQQPADAEITSSQ